MSFGAGLVGCESSTVERQQAVRFAEWLSGHIINCFLFWKKREKNCKVGIEWQREKQKIFICQTGFDNYKPQAKKVERSHLAVRVPPLSKSHFQRVCQTVGASLLGAWLLIGVYSYSLVFASIFFLSFPPFASSGLSSSITWLQHFPAR